MSEGVRTKGELLIKAGYAPSTSLKPYRVLQSRGVQELLKKAENIGLNDELCLNKVKEAITSRNLPLAVNTIFNFWRVKYPQEKTPNVNIDNRSITVNNNDVEAGVRLYLDNNPEWLESYLKDKNAKK